MNVAMIITCLANLFLLSANKPKYGAITEISIPDSAIVHPHNEVPTTLFSAIALTK